MDTYLALIHRRLGRATKGTEDVEVRREKWRSRNFGGSAGVVYYCSRASIRQQVPSLRVPRMLQNGCRVTLASIHYSSSRALTNRQFK